MYTKYVYINLLILLCYFPYCQQKALDAKQHLFTYGFLDSLNPDEKTMKKGVEKFQTAMDLEITGSLNANTLAKMSSPRCGMPSNVPNILTTRHRKWKKRELTYKIQNWTEPFTMSQVKEAFDRSIRMWTNDVKLKIKESSSSKGDINVYFSAQDGPHDTLGYAYYPEHGGIYFDKDEAWTLKSSPTYAKVHFDWVAVHEIGHSLGLKHSQTRKSIMFPYYSQEVTQPTDFDINNLRALYGSAVADNSILCQETNICAMLNLDDNIIIKGKQFWKLSAEFLKSGPFRLDEIFPGLPNTVDAAFAVRKTVYFFKGNIFYRFKSNNKMPLQKLISVGFEGVPSDINAAFFQPSSKVIYFFKGSKYYAFDTTKLTGKRLTVNGKSIANDWNGIPDNVEAAILSENNKALFIKESKCYTIDMTSRELLSNEDCKKTLFKC